LPAAYDVPLLELLIVDPYYLFVSWEIPPAQLEQARAALGDKGFNRRQLELRLRGADGAGVLSRQALYGEIGRWFVRHDLTGRAITAELGFCADEQYYALNQAGPVDLPRDFIIEPEQFDELEVRYGSGSGGELVLEGLRRKENEPWPDVQLPAPRISELIDLEEAAAGAGGAMPSSPAAGLPASPGLGGGFSRPPAGAGEAQSDGAT
jgi:hypothetical protein